MIFENLMKEDIVNVVEGKKNASRVPIIYKFWVHPTAFGERENEVYRIMDKYPEDVQRIGISMPDVYKGRDDDPEYRWMNFDAPVINESKGLDERGAIEDWEMLDDILKKFPNPEYKGMFPDIQNPDGRYRLGNWWFCFFERHWQLRGMTNALMDYYTDPESVHRLFDAICSFYERMIERSAKELKLDGIFVSDDLGTQNNSFFSIDIFREFFKPYYKRIIDKAHENGMHFWLHSCGNIENLIPDLIEIGLDVLHPIQKHTMDQKKIANLFGDKICIWAGFDVQQVIPWGTELEVRQEVRDMIDTYARKDGRFMLTAGNGVNGDCTLESLDALFDESLNYGYKKIGEVER